MEIHSAAQGGIRSLGHSCPPVTHSNRLVPEFEVTSSTALTDLSYRYHGLGSG